MPLLHSQIVAPQAFVASGFNNEMLRRMPACDRLLRAEEPTEATPEACLLFRHARAGPPLREADLLRREGCDTAAHTQMIGLRVEI
jgi:hypothetical protein